MSSIFGYVRVSHDDSTLSGLSPQAQREAILRYVKMIDGTLSPDHYPATDDQPGIYTDYSQSAWKCKFDKRPAGREIQSRVQPGDHVVIMSIDRGFRDTGDFLDTVDRWRKRGVFVHFLHEQFNLASANGRLLGSIIASLAEWQSHVKSERMRDAAAAKKEKNIVGRKKVNIARWKDSDVIIPRLTDQAAKPATGTIYTYGRKSRVERVDDQSLAAQKIITDRHAQYLMSSNPGMSVGQHFEDSHVSAYSKDFRIRPAGEELNKILKSGDVVVVTRLDRAWRRLVDMLNTLQDWTARGITVHFCDMMLDTNTVMGKFFLQIMAMFAELESSMKSASTKAALAVARSKGRLLGAVPMGAKVVRDGSDSSGPCKKLSWDHKRLRHIKIARYLVQNRGWSISGTVAWLERVEAKREGREPIPEWGRVIRNTGCTKSRYPVWNKVSMNIALRRYDTIFAPVINKADNARRAYMRRKNKRNSGLVS